MSDPDIRRALEASMLVSYASRPEVISGDPYAWDELSAQTQAVLLDEHAASIATFLRGLPPFAGHEVLLGGVTPTQLAAAVERAAHIGSGAAGGG